MADFLQPGPVACLTLGWCDFPCMFLISFTLAFELYLAKLNDYFSNRSYVVVGSMEVFEQASPPKHLHAQNGLRHDWLAGSPDF
jgi:hypothetical protein